MTLYLTDPTSHTHKSEIQNMGDIIIKDAVVDNLPLQDFQDRVKWTSIDFTGKDVGIKKNDYLVLAGANIISNRPWFNRFVWRPNRSALTKSNFLILFGVGWWQYQARPDLFTKFFYNRYLVKGDVFHSVRDGYTKLMLEKAGIGNVLNTGCPTMWKLPETMQFRKKSEQVIFTLTDYNKNYESDRQLINILSQEYKRLLFFPQGTEDTAYLNTLVSGVDKGKITCLKRDIESFNTALEEDTDYVGTRLHAGIRALQKRKRAIVISIDNRAVEISKDTGLVIVPREDISRLPTTINETLSLKFKINKKEIAEYKNQLNRFIVKK